MDDADIDASAVRRLGFTAPNNPHVNSVRQVIYSVAGPAPVQTKMRLAPHPGTPTMRVTNSSYKKTGFSRPVMSGVRSASMLPLRILKTVVPLPENFCWQPQDLTSTFDQGQCGSCWAHAASSVLGDRVSVQTNGKIRTALSIQQIMECSDYLKDPPPPTTPDGCSGNEVYITLKSLEDKNIGLNAHNQYLRQYSGKPSDPKSCASGLQADKYSVAVSSAFLISEPIGKPGDDANGRNIENMKSHIFNEGPIIGCFQVYPDFMDYDGLTIYQPSQQAIANAKNIGGHAIEIIGWGKDPATGAGYWVCRNSWGMAWPQNHKPCSGTGNFFFLMGVNCCQIESWCAGATPVVTRPDLAPRDVGGLYPGEVACKENDWSEERESLDINASAHITVAHTVAGLALAVLIVAIGVYVYRRNRRS